MKISYFNESNYGELCGWWDKHQHAIIPYSSLPIGVVIANDTKKLAMAFIYTMDGSDVAQLAWTTTNPENSPKESHASVDLAIDALLQVAQKKEKKLILCFSASRGLSKILNRKNINTQKEHVLNIGSF